ncbi:uncharacterized protein OCT59_011424 [Rhizophagus irregularis]|uniref:uncharacterized protein n=1 Tax=Rhizophagus irregularis TaxID=588596 RepID=UPI0033303C69|nr:hypothetical protein OCT59_011424 [Rhizophagus irregularis]
MNMIFKNNSNFLNFSLREHKPADIYQPILTNGGNNVNISGTTARTQMTHRACLMLSFEATVNTDDPSSLSDVQSRSCLAGWNQDLYKFFFKPDIYQPILKSGGNNIIISGTTDGGTFNFGPSEKKEIAWSVG